MKTIEFFSRTKSFSKVANELGYQTFTIDNDVNLNPDLCVDILHLNLNSIPYIPDIIWLSPPCEAFSVAAIGKNWNKETKNPKSIKAIVGLELLKQSVYIIKYFQIYNPNLIFYIENPRGMMRKILPNILKYLNITFIQHTITYCQYGDNRMKPTDIWTNDLNWIPRKACKNGMSCHISAPRGSRTGTQGLKNSKERGIIPEKLFYDILI